MFHWIIHRSTAVMVLTALTCSTAYAKRPLGPMAKIYAKAYAVIDNQTGQILASRNADKRLPMASTTKIMTALLVIEALDAGYLKSSDRVTIKTNNTGSGDGALFQAGERVAVDVLLDALMIRPSNEAALSLGLHLARTWRGQGTLAASKKDDHAYFAKWMTRRAKLLNLKNTHFGNAHGRDPEDVTKNRKKKKKRCVGNQFNKQACKHYSSARDLALLTKFALKNPRFRALVGQKKFTHTETSPPPKNTHQLMGQTVFGWEVYGVKTGTTNRAGHCLVTAATKGKRDLTVVVLRATVKGEKRNGVFFWPSDLKEVRVGGVKLNNEQRYEDTKKLLQRL